MWRHLNATNLAPHWLLVASRCRCNTIKARFSLFLLPFSSFLLPQRCFNKMENISFRCYGENMTMWQRCVWGWKLIIQRFCVKPSKWKVRCCLFFVYRFSWSLLSAPHTPWVDINLRKLFVFFLKTRDLKMYVFPLLDAEINKSFLTSLNIF